MTRLSYYTVGRAPVGNFPAVAAPWVEMQIAHLPPDFVGDVLLREDPLYLAGPGPRHFEPKVAGEMLADLANLYKKNCMVFRWVANAVLHNAGIRETRPAANYRYPALKALADSLAAHYEVETGPLSGEFKNPLRMLVETVYQGLNRVSDDEAALLFLMLGEAVGVPCRLVFRGSQSQGWRVYAEAQMDGETWFPFDFAGNKWGSAPEGGRRLVFIADAGPGDTKQRPYGIAERNAVGQPPVSGNVMGSGRTDWCVHWRSPSLRPLPEWFADLNQSVKALPPGFHDPFLSNKYFSHARTDVAENFGPERTGAIIAYMTRLYADRYGDLLRRIVRTGYREMGVPETADAMTRAHAIADMVRTVFPYAEETVGVEEITSPLRMWWFHAHYPGVQKFDCDDLTTNFMTLAEADGIPTGIRLAGDAGKSDKYHVYPFVIQPNGDRVIFDVSAPGKWGTEMSRGNNFVDYVPRMRDTYESHFMRGGPRRTAAGYWPPVAGARVPVAMYPPRVPVRRDR